MWHKRDAELPSPPRHPDLDLDAGRRALEWPGKQTSPPNKEFGESLTSTVSPGEQNTLFFDIYFLSFCLQSAFLHKSEPIAILCFVFHEQIVHSYQGAGEVGL